MQDAFGNRVLCSSPAAVRAYDRAVDNYLHALPGVLQATEEALTHDPQFALAHTLRALSYAMYGRSQDARECLVQASACSTGTSEREKAYLDLIRAIVEGRVATALSAVELHASRYPTDIAAVAPAIGAYGLFAFSGRLDHDAARLAFVERLAPHYAEPFPWLLAHRGWCRIECGAVDEGLAMVLDAIAARPANGHNAHMVMHGYHEKAEPQRAQDFIARWLPTYPDGDLMWGHLQWHWALTELALGHDDLALSRLLGPILDYLPHGTPFMALPDTVSLLWRLGLRGKRTSAWTTAREHARRFFPNGSNTFGEVHLAMLAAAYRDRAELEACEARLQATARAGHDGADVARHWVRALRALVDDDKRTAIKELDCCRAELPRIGGSRAQRGIVDETRMGLRLPTADLES